jgi:hypothetical protein
MRPRIVIWPVIAGADGMRWSDQGMQSLPGNHQGKVWERQQCDPRERQL